MHKSGRTLHICLANVRKFRFNDVMHYITTIKGVSSNEKKEKKPWHHSLRARALHHS